MEPVADNGGRWTRFATEAEVKAAMQDKNAEIIETPVTGHTFVVSRRAGVMVRAGAMGGDTFNIECAWLYPNDIALLLDAHEVKQVAEVKTRV